MNFDNIDILIHRVLERLDADVVELLVAIGILVVFLIPALQYEGPLGQFPRVFLFAGILFLSIELFVLFLPNPYRDAFQEFTSGLTDDVSREFKEDVEERAAAPDGPTGVATEERRSDETVLSEESRNFGSIVGALAVFFALAYLFGFLLAVPVVALGIIYRFGSGNLRIWLAVTVVLVVMVYGLFGEVMNVPIMEGELP